jgi:hypothetical protein
MFLKIDESLNEMVIIQIRFYNVKPIFQKKNYFLEKLEIFFSH